MRITNILIACIVIANQAFATNYYLSGKGNDLQSGTSTQTPWRSLKKISEVMRSLQPGDSILLERGSVFVGELRVSVSGRQGQIIYVGAYGAGAKPVITGSVLIKNWTFLHGNVWMSGPIEGREPSNLFIEGQYQNLGRYPNEGYITFSCPSVSQTTLVSNLGFDDGFWNSSEVVVKSSRWTLDNLPVSNYFDKTFHFSSPSSYPLQNGFGFFIQKHVATLDQPGEWFFDKTLKRIFLYCKNKDKPSSHKVEVSMINVGLEMSNVNFVTIENLVFKNQRKSGAEIKYCDNIKLRSCVFEYAGCNGIEIASCHGPAIELCRIENSNNNGVEWINNVNGVFVRNFIHRTGLYPGRGSSANGTYVGLSISSDNHHPLNNLFQFNSIDSTGYIGIDFRTGGTSIVNNLVSNFCIVKDDGAGIYTWGNTFGDNLIKGNIVLRGRGCGDGTNDSAQRWVHGIYIDDRSSDVSLINNTVAYCSTNGIYVHNANRITIHGNTLFANGAISNNEENTQLCIKLDAIAPLAEGQAPPTISVTENRFVTLLEGNHCVYLRAEKEKDLKGLRFDRNLYSVPQANLVIAKLVHHKVWSTMDELDLADWQQLGNDKNSQFKIVDAERSESLIGSNLIKNSSMTNNTEGWIGWPSEVSVIHDKTGGTDGPCLKVQFPTGNNEGLLYYAGISLNGNKWYRLSFSAKSVAKSKIEFVPLLAVSPWDNLGDYTYFSTDTVFKSFTYLFKPNTSSNAARMNFKCNTIFWIDNVTLSEIGYNPGAEDGSTRLVYNADEKTKTILLKEKFKSVEGGQAADRFVLQGYSSRILLRIH